MHLDATSGDSDKSEVSGAPEQSRAVPNSNDFLAEKQELEWVLSHPEISRSASLVRFLSFICAKYFDGESKDIREPTIAVQALGRKESNFDSHTDPIVRVTARTLRKKLQMLYEGDAQDHQLQIVLPRGHYIPQFVRRGDAPAESPLPVEVPSLDQVQLDSAAMPGTIAPADPDEDAGSGLWQAFSKAFAFVADRRALWKYATMIFAVAAIFLAGVLFGRHTDQQQRPVGEALKWGDPVWSDEFDGTAQQLPDPSKWTYDLEDQTGLGDGGREVFCSPTAEKSKECDPRRPSAFQDGAGHLVLRAEKNANGAWTQIRITTKGLKNFQYGRIEARMKLPVGTGLWPSFVMVGADKDTVGWPACGSMDVAENVSLNPHSNGLGPTMIRSTLHGPRYFGSNGLWHDFKLPYGGRVDDGSFHTYGIVWSPDMVQFYVDDPANAYVVQDVGELPEGGAWVFDHPFFLTMGLAVGGDWAGNPDATTPNPATVLVDYVRAYQIPTVQAPSIEWHSVNLKSGSSATSTISLRAPNYAGRVHLTCSTDTPTAACSLGASVVNFSDTLSQEDTLTISTNSLTEKGRVAAPPGRYQVTITATTISGDQSQLTVPFEVRGGD
jgi:beta-glucanase (GH16 family)